MDQAPTPGKAAQEIQQALKTALNSPDLFPADVPDPPFSSYQEDLLHADPAGRFSIFARFWLPGQRTQVSHPHSWCCFGIWEGRGLALLWKRGANGSFHPGPRSVLYPGDVEFLSSPADMHQIFNDGTTRMISIHIRGKDLGLEAAQALPRSNVEGLPPLCRNQEDEEVVAVIGGGFSGTMTAVHLLRHGDANLRVVLFERALKVGKGAAYGTSCPMHLLNVPAQGISAFPDQPDHFLDWCHAKRRPAAAGEFLPRQWYGEYLADLLKETATSCKGRLEIKMEEVIRADRQGNGFLITSADGETLSFSAVVLAIGTSQDRRRLPISGAAATEGPEMIDPWQPGSLAKIGTDETVLIVGNGLTAMDVLAELDSHGHRAGIVALSRRGLQPIAHHRLQTPKTLDVAAFRESLAQQPRKVSAWCRHLRATMKETMTAGGDWREVLRALRPVTAELWAALPAQERQRFLRHLKPYWEIARHQVAPATEEAARRLREKGVLANARGRLCSLRKLENGSIEAVWVDGKLATQTRRCFDRVINATGFSTRLATTTSPLLRHLLASDRICEDALGLGVETASDLRLVNSNGKVVAGIHYVGPMLRARFWECTAVPELRCRARQVADAVLMGLRAHS